MPVMQGGKKDSPNYLNLYGEIKPLEEADVFYNFRKQKWGFSFPDIEQHYWAMQSFYFNNTMQQTLLI